MENSKYNLKYDGGGNLPRMFNITVGDANEIRLFVRKQFLLQDNVSLVLQECEKKYGDHQGKFMFAVFHAGGLKYENNLVPKMANNPEKLMIEYIERQTETMVLIADDGIDPFAKRKTFEF